MISEEEYTPLAYDDELFYFTEEVFNPPINDNKKLTKYKNIIIILFVLSIFISGLIIMFLSKILYDIYQD